MITVVQPGSRKGTVTVPSSKSLAHRQLICAALSEKPSVIECDGISKDIAATMDCLNALGASITLEEGKRICVKPVSPVFYKENEEKLCHCYCGESGSTLRFLVSVTGALGRNAVFHMEGKLPERPITPLSEELVRHGMTIRQEKDLLYVSGQLTGGTFTLPGNISSQYISGLLMALPHLSEDSQIVITEHIESADYITMTEDVLKESGIRFSRQEQTYWIQGNQHYAFPQCCVTERDWSGAAFFLCMGALSAEGIRICGLSEHSSQGDRRIAQIVEEFGAKVHFENGDVIVQKKDLQGIEINAAAIPDLVPTVAALAALSRGTTVITHAERLRIKESDRLQTVSAMLNALGASVRETPDGLIIEGKEKLRGGAISPAGDHRIAMAAAVAANGCQEPVIVNDSECVRKSYTAFWEDLEAMEVEA